MIVTTETISLQTKGHTQIIDITDRIQSIVGQQHIQSGQVLIFVPGSTGGLTTVEFEPGLLKDLPEAFDRIAPTGKTYHHDATWHDGNGYAHVRASMLGPSLTVPIHNSVMTLGTWQQIVFIDFDNRSRARDIIVQVTGIPSDN
jgi:secondary thiamine-phosphate synthase enzyme